MAVHCFSIVIFMVLWPRIHRAEKWSNNEFSVLSQKCRFRLHVDHHYYAIARAHTHCRLAPNSLINRKLQLKTEMNFRCLDFICRGFRFGFDSTSSISETDEILWNAHTTTLSKWAHWCDGCAKEKNFFFVF